MRKENKRMQMKKKGRGADGKEVEEEEADGKEEVEEDVKMSVWGRKRGSRRRGRIGRRSSKVESKKREGGLERRVFHTRLKAKYRGPPYPNISFMSSMCWKKKDYSMINLLFHGRQCLCRLYYYYNYQGMGFFLSLNVALNCSIEQNLKQLLFLIVMPTKETTMAQLFIYNLREWRFCFHSTFKFFCTPAIYDWLYDAIFFSLFWRYFKKRRDNSFFLTLEEISVFSEPFLFQDTDFLSPSRPSCY